METDKAAIGALLLIVGVVGINLLMYAIVRGWARSGGGDFLKTFGKSARPKEDNELAELRRRVEELEKERKEN